MAGVTLLVSPRLAALGTTGCPSLFHNGDTCLSQSPPPHTDHPRVPQDIPGVSLTSTSANGSQFGNVTAWEGGRAGLLGRAEGRVCLLVSWSPVPY